VLFCSGQSDEFESDRSRVPERHELDEFRFRGLLQEFDWGLLLAQRVDGPFMDSFHRIYLILCPHFLFTPLFASRVGFVFRGGVCDDGGISFGGAHGTRGAAAGGHAEAGGDSSDAPGGVAVQFRLSWRAFVTCVWARFGLILSRKLKRTRRPLISAPLAMVGAFYRRVDARVDFSEKVVRGIGQFQRIESFQLAWFAWATVISTISGGRRGRNCLRPGGERVYTAPGARRKWLVGRPPEKSVSITPHCWPAVLCHPPIPAKIYCQRT